MKLLTFVVATAVTVIGGALTLFGLATIIALACAEGAGGCAAASVFIGIPLAMFGTFVLVEFWPGRED